MAAAAAGAGVVPGDPHDRIRPVRGHADLIAFGFGLRCRGREFDAVLVEQLADPVGRPDHDDRSSAGRPLLGPLPPDHRAGLHLLGEHADRLRSGSGQVRGRDDDGPGQVEVRRSRGRGQC